MNGDKGAPIFLRSWLADFVPSRRYIRRWSGQAWTGGTGWPCRHLPGRQTTSGQRRTTGNGKL